MINNVVRSDIKCLNWNARGIRNKIDELGILIGELNIDVAVITETFLKPNIPLRVAGFSCYRADRLARPGGGVAILIRNSINHHVINPACTNNLENVAIKINNTNQIIVAAYNAPNKTLLATDLAAVFKLGHSVLLTGDLNAKHPQWNCNKKNNQGTVLHDFACVEEIHILSPNSFTHFPTNNNKPSTIDLTLTKNIETVSGLFTRCALSSDHLPVFFTLEGDHERCPLERMEYDKTDWSAFRRFINDNTHLTHRVINSISEIDSSVTMITKLITEAKNKFIPSSAIKPFELKIPAKIKKIMQSRNEIKKIWQKSKNKDIKILLNKLNLMIKTKIKKIKNEMWSDKLAKLNTKDNSIWNFSKSIRNKRVSIPPLRGISGFVNSDNEKANLIADTFYKNHTLTNNNHCPATDKVVHNAFREFNSNFRRDNPPSNIKLVTPFEIKKVITKLKSKKSPGIDAINNIIIKQLPFKIIITLTKIFNACLIKGYFPSEWKVAKVIPIPKPGKDHSRPINYRPISLLSSLSKIFEQIIINRLNLDDIRDEQFGFRKNHSTVHQISRIAEHVTANFNMKKNTGMVLLDVEKAFDTVWHDGLIYKLIARNTEPYLIKIIKSYLKERKFAVSIQEQSSAYKNIPAGVPQGSILGPHLFNIYINDLPNSKNCCLAIYADDTALYASSRRPDAIINKLQSGLNKINKFCNKWKIKLNENKTEGIMFTVRRQPLPQKTLSLGGCPVVWQSKVKYLGVTMDKGLRWGPHLEAARCRGLAAMAALSPIFRRRGDLSVANKLLLYKSMIRPILTYAAPAWNSVSDCHMNRLQTVQNKGVKISFDTPPYTNLKSLHEEINLESISDFCHRMTESFYEKSTNKHTNPLIRSIGDYSIESLYFKYKHRMPKHYIM